MSFVQQEERDGAFPTAQRCDCRAPRGLGEERHQGHGVLCATARLSQGETRTPSAVSHVAAVLSGVSEDSVGEVSSVLRLLGLLSKPVLTPQPEPEHATELGCLAGVSYLQIVITGTEEKKAELGQP